jgi:hypothetical protein
MTYSKEIGGFTGSFLAGLGGVLGIWRAPGPGVVPTDRMLDFDDLGPVGDGQYCQPVRVLLVEHG